MFTQCVIRSYCIVFFFRGKYFETFEILFASVVLLLPPALLALDLTAPDELAVALLVLYHHLEKNISKHKYFKTFKIFYSFLILTTKVMKGSVFSLSTNQINQFRMLQILSSFCFIFLRIFFDVASVDTET